MKTLNEVDRKKEIKKELVSKDLTIYLKIFIPTIVIGIIFGYIGYIYNLDNNGDLKRGIIFGAIYPLGIALIKGIEELSLSDGKWFPYIIYTILWIAFVDEIPFGVGVAILFLIILFFVIYFIYIEIKDRTEEVNQLFEQEMKKQNLTKITPYNKINNTITPKRVINNHSKSYVTPEELYSMDKDELTSDDEELEYECERCFKKISYEEWELNDMMCEDCFMDVHTDDQGNYHDEEIIDKL